MLFLLTYSLMHSSHTQSLGSSLGSLHLTPEWMNLFNFLKQLSLFELVEAASVCKTLIIFNFFLF